MKKTVITTIIVVVLSSAGLVTYLNLSKPKTADELSLAEAKRGNLEIAVYGTGELVAWRSFDVRGPNVVDNFNFRAAPLRITDIVPEGTIVKKGDYIATLDRSGFSNQQKDEQVILNDLLTGYDLKLIDTAVTLSTLRDDIRDQVYAVEEAEIAVQQSFLDPPAVQRQVETEHQRMLRHLDQKRRIYSLQRAQAYSEVSTLRYELERQKRKVNDLEKILAEFTVVAPYDGMVIYKRDRLGNKIRAGSMLYPFNPVVATLPDLSTLVSKTYVSEVEVSRVKKGMPVQVKVEALNGKIFDGYVAEVANIGEQLPNSDSKVFEVLVSFNADDPALKPALTTENKVIIKNYENVLFVPLESLHASADNLTFVYTRNGDKQLVIPGEANDRFVIIEKGLTEGMPVYTTVPMKHEKFRLAGIDNFTDPLFGDLASTGKGGTDYNQVPEGQLQK
jgi:multidrug efflux pump subunit AcrA (membrane-fusion protein)